MRSSTSILCLSHLALSAVAALAEESDASFIGTVGTPSSYQSPRFRWWWPGGWIDPDEVASEITAILEAGFGGGEIGDVEDSIKVALDPDVYGWGQARWNAGVLSAYETANGLGGHVDLTLGPHWPTGVPGYTPDSAETSKELVHGQLFLGAGESYTGDLPLPTLAPSGNETANIVTSTPVLQAILVAKNLGNSSSVVTIDPTAVQVLDIGSDNTTVSYTAPSDGTYVLVAVYGRGTGQVQNIYDGNTEAPVLTSPSPAYIVDHLSSAGVQAVVDYWEQQLLTPELKAQLNESQGSMFEDSLELKLHQYWTLNFLEEFQTRRGYDLTPFLLYVIKDGNTFSGDGTVAAQVTNDFYQTVSDLYTNYRLTGLLEWANGLGLKLRVQPYTASFDSSYAASILDIPEGESLGFDGDNDAFRVLAAGRDIGGKTTILSDELGAYMGEAYGVTWKFILGTANHDMSLGVSQVVIHGFPYRDSPSSLWPGFAPFTPLGSSSNGFADAWGPRQPQWAFANASSSYLARAQMLLQQSGSSVDVAILNQAWGVTAKWSDSSLNAAGYSYQFPTPFLLKEHDVQVSDGRLSPGGPAYKALIINNLTTMDIETADMILSYAQDGLPLVLVGTAPNSTFSYSNQTLEETSTTLQSIFTQITSLSSTKSVDSQSDVPAALASLDVQPSVKYAQSTNTSLITYRRIVDAGFYYWVYNDGDDTVHDTLLLEGDGAPYLIDLWTGDVSPVTAFTASEGRVAVNVTLTSTSTLFFYVGSNNPFNAQAISEHIISGSCSSYFSSAGQVYLTSNTSCEATTSLNRTVTLDVGELPSPTTLSSWSLQVQDWSPAILNATGTEGTETTKEWLPAVNITQLAAWPNITSLESASGVGVYLTSVNLTTPAQDVRILLSVGTVEGTYGLSVNGKNVSGIDQFGNRDYDITDLVVDGDNDFQITVATTLWNKLKVVWPAVYGSLEAQLIGLTGPVEIWYVQDQAI